MNGRITQTVAWLSLLILACSGVACRQASALAGELDVPTTTVKQADVQLKILTTGALRSKESRVIAAPPIAGGTLQIVKLARFGAQVHKGEVVLEFDPSQQEYNLAQNRSDLLQAEQEIAKAKADAAVQTAEDQTALLKAKYTVRQAELEVSKNELVSKIDAQKNILALDEAQRAQQSGARDQPGKTPQSVAGHESGGREHQKDDGRCAHRWPRSHPGQPR